MHDTHDYHHSQDTSDQSVGPGHTSDHGHSLGFEVKLLEKKEIAEGTMAFTFQRPEGLEFKAGQHAEWTLINPPETDAEGNNRMFSLVSSPSEDKLEIATRMRDTAFKRVLGKMNIGDTISVANPHGSFTLHNDITKPAVFLIGGIGITPVMSIIKDATERNLPHQLFLFYSNRQIEDAAFFEELKKLAEKNSQFTFIPTMTKPEMSSQSWSGETGYIDRSMIEKYVPNFLNAIYYISGPVAMAATMRKLLNEVGVNEDNIKTEEFTGY